jgi:hypothetical protein
MPRSANNWLIQGKFLARGRRIVRCLQREKSAPGKNLRGGRGTRSCTRKLVRAADGDSNCRSGPPFYDRDAQKSSSKWGEKNQAIMKLCRDIDKNNCLSSGRSYRQDHDDDIWWPSLRRAYVSLERTSSRRSLSLGLCSI